MLRLLEPGAALVPGVVDAAAGIAAEAVGMVVEGDERRIAALEALPGNRRAGRRGGDGGARLRDGQGAVRGKLAREQVGEGGRGAVPRAGQVAAQDGNAVAPARFQPFERLVERANGAEDGRRPLLVPRGEGVGEARRRDLVVVVVREEPRVVGNGRLERGEPLRGRALPLVRVGPPVGGDRRRLLREGVRGRIDEGGAEAELAASDVGALVRPDEDAAPAVGRLPPEDARAVGRGRVREERPAVEPHRVGVRPVRQVADAGIGEEPDEGARDAGVVGDLRGLRPDAPRLLHPALGVERAAELLEAHRGRRGAAPVAAHVEASAAVEVQQIADRRRVARGGVSEEAPPALGDPAERGGVAVRARVGRRELADAVEAQDGVAALDVGGAVQPEVRVRALDAVDRPAPRRRRAGREVRLGDERPDGVRAASAPHEPPPVAGHEGEGAERGLFHLYRTTTTVPLESEP